MKTEDERREECELEQRRRREEEQQAYQEACDEVQARYEADMARAQEDEASAPQEDGK